MAGVRSMPKIFIDTNLFLSLYECTEDIGEIWTDIGKCAPHLVVPDVVTDEFIRNRDRILEYRYRQIKNAEISVYEPPAFLRLTAASSHLRRLGDDYNQNLEKLAADLQSMITRSETDPIFQAFGELIAHPEVMLLRRTGDQVERAHRRKLIGNPPKSDRRFTIGDELIWEMILDSVLDDLIFITRDMTYQNHITFLTAEFREQTQKSITIGGNISVALNLIGERASEALLRCEREQQTAVE